MAAKERMKVEAYVSESGQRVHADNDEDWAMITAGPPGRRPVLYCPESVERGCSNRLIATTRRSKKKGTITRLFAFHSSVPKEQRCAHAEVSKGVERKDPSATGETSEHAWLKTRVLTLAHKRGFTDTTVEESLADGSVRADVFVPGAERPRVEIQRKATDIPGRTAAFPDAVWLLRAAYFESSRNKSALFGHPCVQVRINRRDPLTRKYVPAQPWDEKVNENDLSVSATGTVLRPRESPSQDEGFFQTHPIDLDRFLAEVWAGERRWHPRGRAHRTIAGWALERDMVTFREWAQKQRELVEMEADAERALQSEEQTSVTAVTQEEASVVQQPQFPSPGRGRSAVTEEAAGRPRDDLVVAHTAISTAQPVSATPVKSRRGWWRRIFSRTGGTEV